MNRTLLRVIVIGTCFTGILSLVGCATTGVTKADLDAAQELANRFVGAISRKDLEGTMACVWNSPDMIWVNFGTVVRGYDGFRGGLEQMFAQNESVKLVVNDVSYVPVGDMIMAVGTATIDLQPKNGGASVRIVERWTDLERKIDGRWVYVLDHTTLVPE